MTIKHVHSAAAVILLALSTMSVSRWARAAGTEAPSDGLEEIIVTSQRRSESLQTVPIAITAVTAADMERNGIHEIGTLANQVPGLTFSPFSPGQNIVSLRGVSSNDDGAGTDNSVAVFVDDVYLGRVSNINPEMFDVDRGLAELLTSSRRALIPTRSTSSSRQTLVILIATTFPV